MRNSSFCERGASSVGRAKPQSCEENVMREKRKWPWLSHALCLGVLCLVPSQPTSGRAHAAPQDQPNIVLLIADDLGYGELGCQGNPEIPTPRIDGLAESGVRCTQAYVTAPNCSPSRAGLLTGRFPTRFGYEFNPIGARNEDPGTGIPAGEVTLAESLHDAGYTTALIGKWHLGGTADFHPQRHGFDEFFGFLHEGHYFVPPPWNETTTMLRRRGLPAGSSTRYQVSDALIYSSHMGSDEPDYDADNPILRAGQPVVESDYLTDALAREACSFIERYRSSPFFLCVTFNAVHSPLQAKNDTLKTLGHIEDIHRRIFAAMLCDLDRGIGRIVDTLETHGLRENTLIIFLSDNGGPTKELTSSNLPLRDGKGSMYEGGLRVPFITSWPGMLPKSQVCHELISSLDVFPSVAKLAKAGLPDHLDGVDMLPVLKQANEQLPPRTLYWRQGSRAALRNGPWKIVANQGNARSRNPTDRSWELYHIDSDIGETRNLALENPEMLSALKTEWEELNAQMSEAIF